MLVMAVWFGLALLFSIFVDQCHRARWQIEKHYPEFFASDAKPPIAGILNRVNIYQSITDVHEFLDSGFGLENLPADCQVRFTRIRWLKWTMLLYLVTVLVAAFVLG